MFEATQLNRRNETTQKLFRLALGGMTGLLILPVILIMGMLIWKGAPVISFEFLFTEPTKGMTAGGIFPALLGTVLLVLVALLASVPLGVAPAKHHSPFIPVQGSSAGLARQAAPTSRSETRRSSCPDHSSPSRGDRRRHHRR